MKTTLSTVTNATADVAFTNDTNTFKVNELKQRIAFLESENKKLSETVNWMHALIWDLYKKLRSPIQNRN